MNINQPNPTRDYASSRDACEPGGPSEFSTLLDQARGGDETAAAELVRRYEPMIRRTIRVRLVDNRLRRILDSMDICQSVMLGFFQALRAGRYDVNSPAELVKLLARMADNKLIDRARRESAERRGGGKVRGGDATLDVACPLPSPSDRLQRQERLDAVRRLLSNDEYLLWELHQDGWDWKKIGTHIAQTPEALRKRLSRAMDRVKEVLCPAGVSTLV